MAKDLDSLSNKSLVIAIDFDGTIVTHRYPAIGLPIPYAFPKMLAWQKKGHKLILLTMRFGKELEEAVEYCREGGIEFWGVNENPSQKHWSQSRKVYAHIYIDDAAYGCPLTQHKKEFRPCVDWSKIII